MLETVEEEELEPLPQIEPEVREDSRVAEEKPVIQEEKAVRLKEKSLIRAYFQGKTGQLTGVYPAQVVKINVSHGKEGKSDLIKGKGPQVQLSGKINLSVLKLQAHKNPGGL